MKICPTCHQSYSNTMATCPSDGSPLEFVSLTDNPFTQGQIIDDTYVLEEPLGSGAFSEVWRCQDLATKDIRAVKLLKFFSNDMDEIRDCISRFFREADSASRLGHPNIVEVDHFGRDPEGQAYLVMEYLRGSPLSSMIRKGGLTKPELRNALALCHQVTKGMAAAHSEGILHRDLKPDNIFIDLKARIPHIKILDFGVAKILHDEKLAEISKDFMFGTPTYMSPEQVKGHGLDGRTDIYSLGVIMFELFTGQVPFSGKTAQVLLQHIRNPPPNPVKLNRNIDPDLSRMIIKAMAKHLDNRYQTMDELGEAISVYLNK